jgi:transcriptional regulator with XRE-family HTH domain
MKFNVTPELASLLKTLRAQSGMSAKKLAEAIDKSPSYLSKLESGTIQNIREEDLTEIFSYIAEGKDFYQDKLPNIVRILRAVCEPGRLASQTWLIQYDFVERPIVIPAAMADDISQRMHAMNLKPRRLAEMINANVDSRASELVPANQVLMTQYEEGTIFRIRLHIERDTIVDIVTKNNLNTKYGLLFGLLFNLLKLEKYENIHMEPKEAREILHETTAYLESYEIHPLISYEEYFFAGGFMNRQQSLMNSFDSINNRALQNVMNIFRQASSHDQLMTTKALETLYKNLEWDPSFTLKLISQEFYGLKDMSFAKKKELLKKITELLEEYEQLSGFDKKLEIY